MSDNSISIVPRLSDVLERNSKASEILNWLVSQNIVKSTLSDCVLGSKNGYAISDGAKKICTDPNSLPFALTTNGLDIITRRRIFDTGQNGIEALICPTCQQDIASEDWDFFNEWSDNISNKLTCPLCKVGSEIHEYGFTPNWGFSNLGFTFWNWPPLKNDFIRELKNKLNCDLDIVFTKI